jgi:hypothetical protein
MAALVAEAAAAVLSERGSGTKERVEKSWEDAKVAAAGSVDAYGVHCCVFHV